MSLNQNLNKYPEMPQKRDRSRQTGREREKESLKPNVFGEREWGIWTQTFETFYFSAHFFAFFDFYSPAENLFPQPDFQASLGGSFGPKAPPHKPTIKTWPTQISGISLSLAKCC